jgi:hypothetical protein
VTRTGWPLVRWRSPKWLFGLLGGSDHEPFEAAARAADSAFHALRETPPTTKRALLEYLDEEAGDSADFYEYGLLLRSPVLVG